MSLALPALSPSSLRQRRWLRRTACSMLALAVVWLVTWLAVPWMAKGPLERLATEQLGRTVTVGAIDFKPWSLEVALRDVTVAGANGAPAQLTIDRIYADGAWQSLLRLAPVMDAFTLEAPVLRITHLGSGRYDVDDIITRLTAPPDEPSTGPARMALYNIALNAGRIDFTDTALGKTHAVRALTFKLPFISTLPSQREVKVEPHLSFAVDGSAFDSSAQATPFAQTGKGNAHLRLNGLDLAPYVAYLPAHLPIQVQSALVDADVKIAFEQQPRISIQLSGTVQAREVRLTDRHNEDLLGFEHLKIDMADVRPLDHHVGLQQIELTGPVVNATRNAAGHINFAQLALAAPAAPSTGRASSEASPRTAVPASTASWQITVANAAVRGGTVRWSDQTTAPATALQATDFALEASGIALPFASGKSEPITFQGGFRVKDGALRFAGEATDQKAQINATATALALQLAAPYLARTLGPQVTGQLNGDMGVQWQAHTPPNANANAGATGITLLAGPLVLDKLALQQGTTTLASADKVEVTGAVIPLDGRTATLKGLTIRQPQAKVERNAQGQWMFERWLTPVPSVQEAAPVSAPLQSLPPATTSATSQASPSPWRLRIADFAVQDGAVSWTDNAQPRPVALELSALALTARNLATDGNQPEAFTLSARAAAPGKGSTTGQLSYTGTLALQPLATQGTLQATQLPLHTLDGYLAGQLAVELRHADMGYRGHLAWSQTDQGTQPGTRFRLAGDVVVQNLQAISTAASTPKTEAQVGEELLAWKSLNLHGLTVATAPGMAPRIEVKETSLVDFFARVTVNEAGRINLSELAHPPAEANAANAANAISATTSPSALAPPAAPTEAAASTPTTTAAPTPTLAPVVVFGPVSMVNGKVLFSDFFIRPNYSADLTELTGKLSAFSSVLPGSQAVLADLELRGRAEGSASLEITGKLNPLAQPLALDITGKVSDLELPPLTPYAVKYAGHGIERGKLSMNVNYQVQPNGQLTASNRVVLNQLTFGEPVAGAPNSLPVRLAVALLADRQGVIDLDLPISGSLNDPQFRMGSVIFRVITNLIGKALTAPFSLLASALGGGDDMRNVPFAPGSASLTTEAQQHLAQVVKALTERPALRLTVTGTARLQDEREGLQRALLQERVLAEKRRTHPADPAHTAPVSPDQYPALLKAVYTRTDMPKPRNLVGLAKELTVPEMEALLLAHQEATETMATELAMQRGQAVRAYLLAQKLPAERLFLAAPKTGLQGDDWKPQAQLSLTTQ